MNMLLYELLACYGAAYPLPYRTVEFNSMPEHLMRRKKTVRNHTHVYHTLVNSFGE